MMNCYGLSSQQHSPGVQLRHQTRHNSLKRADAQPKATPQVSFSDTSTLFVYNDVDYLHQEKKAYNDEELYTFKAKAMIDVQRIKYLIVSCQQSSVVESIMYLVENDIITRDELVGLDHLILGRSSSVMQVRRDHMTAVLHKQHEQQRCQLRSKLGDDDDDDDDDEFDLVMELGNCARRSSLQSRLRGIARAKLSSPE